MSFLPQLGRFYILQQVLILASFSLLLLFLVNLYKARSRIVKLRNQGLVRRSSWLLLTALSIC